MTSVFQGLSLSRSGGRVGENPGNEVNEDPDENEEFDDNDGSWFSLFILETSSYLVWSFKLFSLQKWFQNMMKKTKEDLHELRVSVCHVGIMKLYIENHC